jgi:phosphoribosylamine--glycine ligase
MFSDGLQVAVKASGNALGKGVIVCETEIEAIEAIQLMMVGRVFGTAGETVVIEERLIGREFSLLTLCNESGFWSLPVAQDYKRIFDGDEGPNTGGMGSYSPVPWVNEDLVRETEGKVVAPALQYLASQHIPYRGVLFSGLMLTESGVKCLEYNVRFGDPETQSVLRRLGPGFAQALLATATGEPIPHVPLLDNFAVTVVLANAGYPGTVTSYPTIQLPDSLPDGVEIFHAGTKVVNGELHATGGRVLNVSAVGSSLEEARIRAYEAAASIRIEGVQFRKDIGR